MVLFAMPVTVSLIATASILDPEETGSAAQIFGLATFLVYLHGILPGVALAAVHTMIRRAKWIVGVAASIGVGVVLGGLAGWFSTTTIFVPTHVAITIGAVVGMVFGAIVPRAAPISAGGG